MLDLIIRNVQITDGSGRASYIGDVGVSDGKIVLAPQGAAKEEIDGTGKVLCPGFIDSHSHMDRMLGSLDELAQLARLSQGVTTEVTAQCGSSVFPAAMSAKAWFDMVDALPKGGNYAALVGLGSVRRAVMDCRDGVPTEEEMEKMKAYVREGMEEGCFGVSSGLIYIPGVYSTTEELIELTKEAKPYGGVYATHMRSESDHLVEAVEEAIKIAETAGVPLVISHHKAVGLSNSGKSVETLRLVHEAIGRGMSVTMDQYPYEATSSTLTNSIAPWYFTDGYAALTERLKDPAFRAEVKAEIESGNLSYNNGVRNAGGWDRVLIASAEHTPGAEGKTVTEYAASVGKDVYEAYFDLLVENGCLKTKAIFFSICEEDIDRIYMDENTVVGSDAVIETAKDHMHPRAFGTFARSICRFHKEKGLVSFEEAVRKQTSLTAERWGLANKGLIRDGYDADLVLLDYDALRDKADYVNPRQLTEGIEKVFVAGKCVFTDGHLTDEKPGRLLRKMR
ncbi:MAG: D-aminoacylase [Lachnospiraceae bacterium]|nr:D-aminoacylase [Lachnospiraceae bacterium]